MDWMIQNNNKGVTLFHAGDCFGAIQAFQCAMDVLTRGDDAISGAATVRHPSHVASMDPALFSLESCTTTSVTSANALSVEERSTMGNASMEEQSTMGNGTLNENMTLFVFNRPLLLNRQVNVSLSMSPLSMLASRAVLLFNFGLACHQYSHSTGSEILLRRAAELYNLSLSLPHEPFDRHGLLGLIQCLALNNLARVHYDNCEYQIAHDCLECLSELERWSGCLSGSTATSVLWESEYEEIVLNLVHDMQPRAARAA